MLTSILRHHVPSPDCAKLFIQASNYYYSWTYTWDESYNNKNNNNLQAQTMTTSLCKHFTRVVVPVLFSLGLSRGLGLSSSSTHTHTYLFLISKLHPVLKVTVCNLRKMLQKRPVIAFDW